VERKSWRSQGPLTLSSPQGRGSKRRVEEGGRGFALGISLGVGFGVGFEEVGEAGFGEGFGFGLKEFVSGCGNAGDALDGLLVAL